jgi:hypothetical protein
LAIADTARLIATLELQDKFSKAAADFDKAVGGMERKTSMLGRIGSEASRGIGAAANNLKTIGLVGAGVLAASVTAGIHSLERLEEVQTATNAVIKSTGGIADITAEKVRNLAEKYEGLNATIDDKVIQSGENLLLTFTNIRNKAFEPALEAALNLNEALGGGEEGLQGTIIQVGKALQDPIRGLTSLRRVGVNFSEAQKTTIKQLVAQNDLYGAQQIILNELSTEFGGRFAAAGTTATAKFAKFKDAVEDAQMSLATAFLPVLEKVAGKLNTFLSDPKVMAQIKDFGAGLAGGLDDVIDFAGKLPWAAIGDAFKIAGTGAKAVLDAFKAMPPWVQTAVLTGWGLNKLTGGALGGIVGELGKVLIKGVLGMNAGVVNIKAGVVTGVGGGAPVTGGLPGKAGSLALGVAKWVIGPLAAAALGKEIAQGINEGVIGPARDTEISGIQKVLQSKSPADLRNALKAINDQLNSSDPTKQLGLIVSRLPFFGDALSNVGTVLEEQRDALKKQIALLETQNALVSHAAQERKDALPKPLTAAELIAALSKTPVTGPIGRTSILEQSADPRRGQDAFGLSFLGILERTTPAILKTPEVMTEVQNHITELRDVTKFYLNRGDTVAAGKTQTVIEKIEALIGVAKNPEDLAVRAEIKKMADDASRHAASDRTDAAALKSAAKDHTAQVRALITSERTDAVQTHTKLQDLVSGWQAIHTAQGAQTGLLGGILAKPWINNNVVNTNVQVNSSISVDTLTRTFISSTWAISGRAPGSIL